MPIHLGVVSGCFQVTQQCWVVVTDTVWPTNPKIFTYFLALYEVLTLAPKDEQRIWGGTKACQNHVSERGSRSLEACQWAPEWARKRLLQLACSLEVTMALVNSWTITPRETLNQRCPVKLCLGSWEITNVCCFKLLIGGGGRWLLCYMAIDN